MDGWMYRWIDEWMDGWIDEWSVDSVWWRCAIMGEPCPPTPPGPACYGSAPTLQGGIDRQTDRWIYGWMDGWMDRWMDGWMDEWMDGALTSVCGVQSHRAK